MMNRNTYATDLTDYQWSRLRPWIANDALTVRPPKYSKQEIVNAILYVTQTGCPCRLLPHDFTPYRIVFHWFRKW